jgi:class 3 adenylate cyclase
VGGELTVRVLGLARAQALSSRPATLAITVGEGDFKVEAGPATDGPTQVSVRCEGGRRQAVVVLERTHWSAPWISAAQLATIPEFHELFGGEAPRTKHEVAVASLTIVFSDLRGSTALYQKVGDARAFTLVADHFDRLTKAVEANEGALIKTMGDAVMAVFQTPPAAVRAALAMQRTILESESGSAGLTLKLGVHVGTCLAVRANGRLDFFGHNVNLAARAQAQSQGADIVVSEAVLSHPEVAPLVEGIARESFEAVLKGIDGPQRLWRLKPAAEKGGDG